MRRKQEDELIRLAFGDYEPHEAGRSKEVLAEDPSAAKLYAGYAELREGLKQLRTPEHQLSTERLRERILAEGLKKEKASGFTWRWAFTPLAVAASALLITVVLNSRPSGVTGLPGGTSVAMNEKPSSAPPTIDWQPSETNIRDIVGSSAGGAQGLSASDSVSEKAPAAKSDSAPRASLARAERPPKSSGISPAELSNLAIDGALPAGAVALNESSTGDDPIVLIGSDSDETTGANRATEVSSATNVVIGG